MSEARATPPESGDESWCIPEGCQSARWRGGLNAPVSWHPSAMLIFFVMPTGGVASLNYRLLYEIPSVSA
ncbi:MAG: hypothetical protein KDN19_13470 [Verrucomicrobiae bacterium]|nr:hypothetical protein [Verrucomicrobiae bacterium]